MRGVIICGGNVGEYIKNYIKPDDFVICADSGYDRAKTFGIKPDVVIGDMDSTGESEIPYELVTYPVRKDFTDSELAVDYAIEKGFHEILMFGMIGTRMDHSLANITLLQRIPKAVIIDANNEIYYAVGKFAISGKAGDTVSIIPYMGDCVVAKSKGLDYPLLDTTIKCGTTLGVSNVMTDDICEIEIEKGSAFIIRSRD